MPPFILRLDYQFGGSGGHRERMHSIHSTNEAVFSIMDSPTDPTACMWVHQERVRLLSERLCNQRRLSLLPECHSDESRSVRKKIQTSAARCASTPFSFLSHIQLEVGSHRRQVQMVW